MVYLYLALAFVCNGAANVLLKVAALNQFSFAEFFRGAWGLSTVYAGSAVVLFGLNLVFYLFALEKVPLSVGYPVMVGMTFFITVGASLFLGEKISLIHTLGMVLILAGIVIILRAVSS